MYNINNIMVSALSVTVNMPNIGLIIYYLVCIIPLPIILINTQNEKLFNYKLITINYMDYIINFNNREIQICIKIF